mmetsp:Transcript_136099/g.254341  ORF Transcript_136099/g.254341 Transcript_136099/m.254341 type:complete len:350 (-) Transcript_136099:49-1098(-)
MDIQPHNSIERVFAVLTLLVAFLLSACAVSSITTSMTHLELVTTQQSTSFAMLRQYLNHNHISKVLALRIQVLALRIQRSAQTAVNDRKRDTPEAGVELLKYVSEPLRVELHYELNAQVLIMHPFFYYYDMSYSSAMRQVCHSGVSRLTLHRGDVLFSTDTAGEPRMFFFFRGRMNYWKDSAKTPTVVKTPEWACEYALWTSWSHRGLMQAATDCGILILNADTFQKIACQFISKDANIIQYGKELLRHLNITDRSLRSDLPDPSLDLEDLAARVFPDVESNVPLSPGMSMIERLQKKVRTSVESGKSKGEADFKPRGSLVSNTRGSRGRGSRSSKGRFMRWSEKKWND